MSRTQDVVDKLQDVMLQSGDFSDIKEYVQSPKHGESFLFPLCIILVDSDDISQVGASKTAHVMLVGITYLNQDWHQEGNRHSYTFADALETLLKTNRTFTLDTGEVLSVYLVRKLYGLELDADENTVDGVTCEVEVTFYTDAK